MRMLLIDVNENEIKPLEVNCLEDYYEHIGCRCIDIVRRKIGDRYFEIIIDDEGLFVDEPIVSAIDENNNVMLVGNLLIASGEVDIDGNLTSIDDSDIDYIYNFIGLLITVRTNGKSANIALTMSY